MKVFRKTRRLELVSLLHFANDFWRKMFLTLRSINRPNFFVWLPLLEIFGNMCIEIICCPVFDVMNFEINLNLLIMSCST